MNKKFLCKCGHLAKEHTGFWDITGKCHISGCTATLKTDGSCLCWSYKLDNLAFLELMSEAQSVGK